MRSSKPIFAGWNSARATDPGVTGAHYREAVGPQSAGSRPTIASPPQVLGAHATRGCNPSPAPP